MAVSSKKRYRILPLRAILYFMCSLVIVLLLLACIDRLFLPDLELKGVVPSAQWKYDDGRIFEFLTQRNGATNDVPVWRSSAFPVSQDAHGKKRILVMGDSYVWGDGHSNMNDLWWRQLHLELQHRGYNNVEVIGAGLCGASTHMELDWAQKLLPIYKPDLIIFGYVTNDPDEGSRQSGEGIVKQLKSAPADTVFDEFIRPFEEIFPHLTYQLKGIRAKKRTELASGPRGYEYSEWEARILEGENFQAYRKTVGRLKEFASRTGVPCVVTTLPMPVENNRSKYEPVEKLFTDAGLPFLNNLEPMLAWAKKHELKIANLRVSPVNGHPSIAATNFYAIQVANFLETSFAEKLGPKSTARQSRMGVRINDYVPPVLGVTNPNPNIYSMFYPQSSDLFLTMPFGLPYVQLNLESPKSVKEIHVIGKGLKSARLWVRGADPDAMVRTVAVHDLGARKGAELKFNLPAEKWSGAIDELMISADFADQKNMFLLEFVER